MYWVEICFICFLIFIPFGSPQVAKKTGYSTLANSSFAFRNDAGAWFDYPRSSLHPDKLGLTQEALATMVDVVSERFNLVVIANAMNFQNGTDRTSDIFLLTILASHNRNCQIVNQTCQQMKAFPIFQAEQKDFKLIKKASDLANELSPGTVETLVMMTNFTNFETFQKFDYIAEQLESAKNDITSSRSSNKLGVILPVEACDQNVSRIFTSVDTTIIYLNLTEKIKPFSSKVVYHVVISSFENCEKNLRKLNKNVEIILADSGPPQNVGDSDALEFWKLINNWSVENKIKVIITHAFDTSRVKGWWRYNSKINEQGPVTRKSFHEIGTVEETREMRIPVGYHFRPLLKCNISLYIWSIIFLSVICAVLMVVIIRLLSRFSKDSTRFISDKSSSVLELCRNDSLEVTENKM